ncbi:MAG: hypothetical protein P8X63_07865 [Desulfuromonadaceae bacterium]|jgi:hypothetical protein
MAASFQHLSPERRQGPDFWVRFIRWMAVTVWALMLIALFLVGWAKPQIATFFDRYYHLTLRSSWDMELAKYIFYCMIGGLSLSISGLVANHRRHRRRGDEYLVSLFLGALLCCCGIVLYLYSF